MHGHSIVWRISQCLSVQGQILTVQYAAYSHAGADGGAGLKENQAGFFINTHMGVCPSRLLHTAAMSTCLAGLRDGAPAEGYTPSSP